MFAFLQWLRKTYPGSYLSEFTCNGLVESEQPSGTMTIACLQRGVCFTCGTPNQLLSNGRCQKCRG